MSQSVAQRWLAVPFILLLIAGAVWHAVRDTGPAPPGAAPVVPLGGPAVGPQAATTPVQPRLDLMSPYTSLRTVFGAMGRSGLGRLPPGTEATANSTISGVVRDRDSGHPITDAFVLAWLVSDPNSVNPQRAVAGGIQSATPTGFLVDTDRNGTFQIGPLRAGWYFLQAYHEGAHLVPWSPPLGGQPMELLDGEEREGVNLFVYEGHTITVKTLEASTGVPVNNVRIRSDGQHLSADVKHSIIGTIFSFQSVTDEDGVAILSGMHGGLAPLQITSQTHYLANATGGRAENPRVELDPASNSMELTLELTPIPELVVRVLLPDGKPAADAEVAWLTGHPRMFMPARLQNPAERIQFTDAAGEYNLTPLGAMDGYLVVRAEGYPMALSAPIDFSEAIPDSLIMQLEEPASLNVTVTMPDGSPASRALVTVTPPGSFSAGGMQYVHEFTGSGRQWVLKELTGIDGAARLTGLSTGQYRIKAEVEGHAAARELTVSVESGTSQDHTFVLGTFADLVGLVLDPDGEPVTGATVRVSPIHGTSIERRTTTTDDEGRFRFEWVPQNQRLHVSTSFTGYAGTTVQVGPEWEEDEAVELKLGAPVQHFTYVLHVVDEQTGEPIANPTVTVNQSRMGGARQPVVRGNTIEIERFRPELWIPIQIEAPGYASLSHTYRRGQDPSNGRVDETVRLGRGTTFTGRVLNEETDEPLAGIVVRVSGDSASQELRERAFVTDEEGRFTIPNLRPIMEIPPRASSMAQSYIVEVESPSPLVPVTRAIRYPTGEVEDLGDLRLGHGRTIRVRVEKDGEPQSGRSVLLDVATNRNPWDIDPPTTKAETNATGAAVFVRVPDGQFTVFLDGSRYYLRHPDSTGDAELLFELGSGRITVRTMRGGEPESTRNFTGKRVDGSGFSIGSPPGTDREVSVYVLDELPAGEWELRAFSPRGGSRSGSEQITVTLAEGEQQEVTLDFWASVIAGRVLDTDGTQVTTGHIYLTHLDAPDDSPYRQIWAGSGGGGTFRRAGVPDGRWLLEVRNIPHRHAVLNLVVDEANPEANADLTIHLVPVNEGVIFDVRCADSQDAIAEGDVHLIRRHFQRPDPYQAQIRRQDDDGRWVFEGLPSGDYRFRITHPWRVPQEMAVTINEGVVDTHQVFLKQAGTLHVSAYRVRSERPAPTGEIRRSDAAPNEPATQEFRLPIQMPYISEQHLEPGEYEVRMFVSDDNVISETFTIVAGEMTRVQLE